MHVTSNIAFKEWAVVVDALGRGLQLLILRKGGLHEAQGQFQVEHNGFWLFPTQYHEAEQSVIPAQRGRVRELAATSTTDTIPVTYYAVADPVVPVTDRDVLNRLEGRHIWTQPTLQQRFDYGTHPGLQALIVRVYRLATPVRLPWLKSYAGCRSWVTLDQAITGQVSPVLTDAEFANGQDELCELLGHHALAHSSTT
jgi:hypothetical protein